MRNIITIDPGTLSFVNKNDFAGAARSLLKNQEENWIQLFEGYESLKKVKTKAFSFEGFEIKVQHNPKRILSSSAKVDYESIKKRECFLCEENLPKAQKGVLYNNEFIILCNPFPIFPEHFTIRHIKHIPQKIEYSFPHLLLLAKDLSKYYTVFYNGPECGASAPDHLHFQAGTKKFMPVEKEFRQLKIKHGEILLEKDNLKINMIDDGLRRFLTLESGEIEILRNSFDIFYELYSEVSFYKIEPMMNILAFYEKESGWKIFIFLRERHRPSFYFEKGENNILWSPAAVDLGGVCIIPKGKDFSSIKRRIIITGFNEITLSGEKFSLIKKKLKQIINDKY